MYKYEWKTVIGTQKEKPKEIDTDSSQYGVYIRENIQEYNETDSEGNQIQGYKYREMYIPNIKYLIEQLLAQEEANDAILLGIAEMWEDKNGGV